LTFLHNSIPVNVRFALNANYKTKIHDDRIFMRNLVKENRIIRKFARTPSQSDPTFEQKKHETFIKTHRITNY